MASHRQSFVIKVYHARTIEEDAAAVGTEEKSSDVEVSYPGPGLNDALTRSRLFQNMNKQMSEVTGRSDGRARIILARDRQAQSC